MLSCGCEALRASRASTCTTLVQAARGWCVVSTLRSRNGAARKYEGCGNLGGKEDSVITDDVDTPWGEIW